MRRFTLNQYTFMLSLEASRPSEAANSIWRSDAGLASASPLISAPESAVSICAAATVNDFASILIPSFRARAF